MVLQVSTLNPTFQKMGWDIESTIEQIEKQLPKKVLDWAKWQLYEFYQCTTAELMKHLEEDSTLICL